MTFPHNIGCPSCRAARICNYCGEALVRRCTNGRCWECHSKVCTPGGATAPGHGSGLTREEVARAIVNEKLDHS